MKRSIDKMWKIDSPTQKKILYHEDGFPREIISKSSVSRKKIKKKEKKTCLPVIVFECFRCYILASPFLLILLLQDDKLSTKFFDAIYQTIVYFSCFYWMKLEFYRKIFTCVHLVYVCGKSHIIERKNVKMWERKTMVTLIRGKNIS